MHSLQYGFKAPYTHIWSDTYDHNIGDIFASPGDIAQQVADALEKGWRLGWRDRMYRDFQFESLHKEPKYKNLAAMFEADLEKQREEVYELVGLKK